jgi:hypothetical protein
VFAFGLGDVLAHWDSLKLSRLHGPNAQLFLARLFVGQHRMFSSKQFDKRGRLVCWCTGYWFQHRHGGGACEHSKTRDLHMAIRYKNAEALADAKIALALDRPANVLGGECPF